MDVVGGRRNGSSLGSKGKVSNMHLNSAASGVQKIVAALRTSRILIVGCDGIIKCTPDHYTRVFADDSCLHDDHPSRESSCLAPTLSAVGTLATRASTIL